MFTPSANQGFNPEWGASLPQFSPQESQFGTSQVQETNWQDQMIIEVEMHKLVPRTISKSTADWLIQEALKDERQAQQLIQRLVRPEGFNNQTIDGGSGHVS